MVSSSRVFGISVAGHGRSSGSCQGYAETRVRSTSSMTTWLAPDGGSGSPSLRRRRPAGAGLAALTAGVRPDSDERCDPIPVTTSGIFRARYPLGRAPGIAREESCRPARRRRDGLCGRRDSARGGPHPRQCHGCRRECARDAGRIVRVRASSRREFRCGRGPEHAAGFLVSPRCSPRTRRRRLRTDNLSRHRRPSCRRMTNLANSRGGDLSAMAASAWCIRTGSNGSLEPGLSPAA